MKIVYVVMKFFNVEGMGQSNTLLAVIRGLKLVSKLGCFGFLERD
jgi:hypothetical protein